MISKRAEVLSESPNFLYAGWQRCQMNGYDSERNPDGVINLGVAENKLMEDNIAER